MKQLSQGDLAKLMTVSKGTISNWESEVSNPSLDQLVVLSRVFGFKIDDMLTKNIERVGFEMGTEEDLKVEDDMKGSEDVNRRLEYLEKFIKTKFPDFL